MKKYILVLLFTTLSVVLFAQESQYGIQAGINYNFSGDLTDLDELESTGNDAIHGAEGKVGYHGGLWYKMEFSGLFLKGEVLYTQYKTSFSGTPVYSITTKKIDVPVVFGMKVLGPLYVFAGPNFQYIIDQDFSLSTSHVTTNDFTMGLNLGVGVEFNRLSFDVRWDKALSAETIEFTENRFTLDNRPNQLVLSLSYALNSSDDD